MAETINITVNAAEEKGELSHDWRYIGYDECNYTYIPEGQALLKKFGSLEKEPYYVRTHFMFCTGNCHGTYKFGSTNIYSEDKDGNPVYDFTIYDMVVDAYLAAGVKPFLEFGFMPMDLVDTAYLDPIEYPWQAYGQYKEVGWSCPPKDYDKWHGLIEELMRHLVSRYGKDEVRSWYLELWNEPDINYFKGTKEDYCKLYDYTEHAVHAVLPEAYLAGPATTGPFAGLKSQEYLRFFLDHCRNGVNACTGETGTRLDYITFHVKGGGFSFDPHAEKACPSVASLVHQVKLGLDVVKNAGYGNLEVVLSESDPDGWAAGGIYDNPNMIFRNTEYYASYVASAYHKIAVLADQYNMRVRPLAWAFFFPGERCFEGTRTFSTQGIDKPVFNLFRLYGKLGHTKLALESDAALSIPLVSEPAVGRADEETPVNATNAQDVSGFAARGEKGEADEIQVLLYSHHDDRDAAFSGSVSLTLSGVEAKADYSVKHYRIDGVHSNAYPKWVELGMPWYPDEEAYAAVKAKEGLDPLPLETVRSDETGTLSLSFGMPAHAVSLLVFRKERV